MNIEKVLEHWKYRYEMAKDFTDKHWEESERREHREYVDVLATTIDEIDKSIKYKWHDLRENPDDLPAPLSKNIYILADWNKYCKNQYGLVDYSADCKWCITTEELKDITVIAWRYIEPFEEVEI